MNDPKVWSLITSLFVTVTAVAVFIAWCMRKLYNYFFARNDPNVALLELELFGLTPTGTQRN